MRSIQRIFWLIFIALVFFTGCVKRGMRTDMENRTYKIKIITSPQGGDIYIGEKLKGTSPITLDMTLDDVLEVRAKKGNLASTGEQLINFGDEDTATLTVFLAELKEKGYPGSVPTITEELYKCKTARTIAKSKYWPEVDYSNIGSIYFDFDKAKLTPTSIKVLDELAPHIYNAYKSGMIIAIEGHTDSTGEEDYNMGLSQKRIDAVVDYFTTNPVYPIPKEKLWVKSWGEKCPLVPNNTQSGRSKNRRTDIILLPISALGELPK